VKPPLYRVHKSPPVFSTLKLGDASPVFKIPFTVFIPSTPRSSKCSHLCRFTESILNGVRFSSVPCVLRSLPIWRHNNVVWGVKVMMLQILCFFRVSSYTFPLTSLSLFSHIFNLSSSFILSNGYQGLFPWR